MGNRLAGFSVHGILQARILEWVAMPFSRGSSRRRERTQGSHIAGRFFTSGPPGEALENSSALSSGTALTSLSTFGSLTHLEFIQIMWCQVWIQFYLFQLATTCLNIIYEIKSPSSAEKEREEPLVFSKRKKFTKVALWCLT